MKLEDVRVTTVKFMHRSCDRCDRDMRIGTAVGYDPTLPGWVHLSHLVNRKSFTWVTDQDEGECQRCFRPILKGQQVHANRDLGIVHHRHYQPTRYVEHPVCQTCYIVHPPGECE